MTTRIGVALGDPAGIGPEVVWKALIRRQPDPRITWSIYGPAQFAQSVALSLDPDSEWFDDWKFRLSNGAEGELISVRPDLSITSDLIGRSSALTGTVLYESARLAIKDALEGKIAAVAAAPHTELSVNQAGIEFSGYPSLLSKTAGLSSEVILLLIGGHLKVAHVTLHQSLTSVVSLLTQEQIISAVRTVDKYFSDGGYLSAKFALCGLNPHAGEDGLFGSEDETITKPAAQHLVDMGINLDGPISADSLFHRSDYDCIVALYHDQGHIPVKTIAPRSCIAISVGTPIIFGTVAHGSALDIAGNNEADPAAMNLLFDHCVKFVKQSI